MFPKIGVVIPPKWMGKIMENPIKMDDLGVFPLFLETPICRTPLLTCVRIPIFFVGNKNERISSKRNGLKDQKNPF